MVEELRIRNTSQQLYDRAYSAAWRSHQLHDPSTWLLRDPDAEEKMLRDADIAHGIGYRRHLIAGKDWTVTPQDEASDVATLSVDVATALLKGIKHFSDGRLNLARAFFSGSRFARIQGRPRMLTIGDGVPRIWWVPVRLEDEDKRFYRIVPKIEKGKVHAHWERFDITQNKFIPLPVSAAKQTIKHVYQDDQATLGHGRALREALGWWWYAKTHTFQESLQAVERFAQGMLVAKIDGARSAKTDLPNTEVINKWVQKLEDMRGRHVLVFDKLDQVEMIQMDGQGWQLLKDMRTELRSTILTLILGANLTTSADKGGSFALAEVQQNSTEALIKLDRQALEDTLSDDLLGCLWFKNHANLVELGIEEEMPRFSITWEQKQDPAARAQVAAQLNSIGIDLALEDVLEQTGFRMPKSGEAIIPGGSPQPSGGGLPGLPGFGEGGLFTKDPREMETSPAAA